METTAPVVAATETPPMGYITAVWLGMPPEQIAQGIAQGAIGAPNGWTEPDSGAPVDDPVDEAAIDDDAGAPTGSAADAAAGEVADTADKPEGKPLPVGHDRMLSLFQRLDATLDAAAFEALWTRSGESDGERSASLVGLMARALLGPASTASADASVGEQVSANVDKLDSFLDDPRHRAHIVDLAGKTGDDLAALARTDPGYRYALTSLDSIAIVGNPSIEAANNLDGQLDRFDSNSGEQNLSDAWLDDRAKLLAWKMAVDAGQSTTLDGDQSWTFIDHRALAPDGTAFKLQLDAADGDADANTVVFGADSDAGEILKGASGTDRLYGGKGDDVLRGNAGGDHLEGGRGDDLVLGGAGNDDVSGDQGNDEVDGGAGTDRLRGGAGDDVLTGGRGDDRMEGGAGHDTYVVDAGDGNDIIVDSDGDGEVQFDGQALPGATQKDGATWRSADGRIRFNFSGDATEGGALTISYYGANAGDDAVPEAVTRVAGWHNGDLGITLGDGTAAALGASTQDVASIQDQAPHNATIPLIPHDEGTSGSDGDGSTWIDPGLSDVSDSAATSADTANADVAAPVDVMSLFDQLASHSDVADSLVTPAALQSALTAWGGVAEAPDVAAAHQDATVAPTGVTPSDLTDALADFHDAGQDFADYALAAPTPDAANGSIQLLEISEGIPGSSGAAGVSGTGRKPLP